MSHLVVRDREMMVPVSVVRRLRDDDRRGARRTSIKVDVAQILIIAPLKFLVDRMLENPIFADVQYIRPYTILLPLSMYIGCRVFANMVIFRRRF